MTQDTAPQAQCIPAERKHETHETAYDSPKPVSPVLKHFCHQGRSSGTRTKVSVSSHLVRLSKMNQDNAPQAPCIPVERKHETAYDSPKPVSPVLKHFCHQGRSSGTRTKVSVSSHLVRLSKMNQANAPQAPCIPVCTQTLNCIRQPQASQSRLETLLPSRPQLRNTDQGECVITSGQAVQNDPRHRTTSSMHTS